MSQQQQDVSRDAIPAEPVDVVVEVLSPDDSFQRVMRKCQIYAEWGIPTILVLDPEGRAGWLWDNQVHTLTPMRVVTLTNGKSITLERIFAELDASL